MEAEFTSAMSTEGFNVDIECILQAGSNLSSRLHLILKSIIQESHKN